MLGRIALAVAMTTGVCSLASAAQPADPKLEIIDQATADADAAVAAAPALAAAPTPRPRPAPAAVTVAQRGLDPAEFAARFAVAGLDEAAEPVAPAAAPAIAAVPLPRSAPVDRVMTASLSPAEPAAAIRAVPAVAVAAPVIATPAIVTAPVATPAVAAPAEVAALQPAPEPAPAQAAVAELAAAEPAAETAAPVEPLPGVAAAADAQREIGEVAGRSRLDQLIAAYADRHDVPEALVRRVVKRESNFNPSAYSAGNWGLMQIRHGTAKAMGYRGPAKGLLDAETNLAYAVKYLAGAYKVAGGNADRAVRLYASGYYYEAKRKGLLEETGLKGGGTVAAADPVPAQQIAGGMY